MTRVIEVEELWCEQCGATRPFAPGTIVGGVERRRGLDCDHTREVPPWWHTTVGDGTRFD